MHHRDIDLTRVRHLDGCCWCLDQAFLGWGDGADDDRTASGGVTLFEDGRCLGPAHALHDDIRRLGGGLYSHWEGVLFFSTSDGTSPLENGRRYRIGFETPLPESLQGALEDAVLLIRRKQPFMAAVRQLLLLPRPEWRAQVFESLGDAFRARGEHDIAVEQYRRAWNLGRFPALAYLLHRLVDEGRFQNAFTLATKAALHARATDDLDLASRALLAFHEAVYTAYRAGAPFAEFQDRVVAGGMAALAASQGLSLGTRRNGPLRIGYLLAGEGDQSYSSLPDIIIELASRHDRNRIMPTIFTLHSPEILSRDDARFAARAARLASLGIPLVHVPIGEPKGGTVAERVRAAAETIASHDLDVFLPVVLTGWHLLIAALRPCRRLMTIGLGDIQLYTSPILDLSVHLAPKPAMDGLCPSLTGPPFIPEGRLSCSPPPVSRMTLGIPDDAVVLFASGRDVKFRSPFFWRLIARVLGRCPRIWVAAAGIDEAFVAALPDEELPASVRSRVRGLGWREDILAIYPSVDIVIDTVPFGGGHSLFEAMYRCIPVIGFRDDNLLMFREAVWTPAFDYIEPPDSVFERGDVEGLVDRIAALAGNVSLRRQAGEQARVAVERYRDASAVAAYLDEVFVAMMRGDPSMSETINSNPGSAEFLPPFR